MPILLTADSVSFLDYSSEAATRLHLKSFTDLMMLSGAEKLYLLKSPKMYNSGFPRMASMIGNKPFQLVRFMY